MYTKESTMSLPFNNFSRHDFTLGENAIINASVFRENDLRLCAGVPLSDLERIGDSTPWAACCDSLRVDYLVCRDQDVILAIEVSDRTARPHPPVRVENLFFAETNVLAMEQGLADNITEKLEDLLQADFHPAWRCLLNEFDDEWVNQLVEAQLLDLRDNGTVVPTEYGGYEGLVTVISPDGRRLTRCSRRVREKLSEMIWSEDDIQNMRFVHELTGMSLAEYTKGTPDALHTLETLLPHPCQTCGEAAELIHRMLRDECEDVRSRGIELLLALALPLYHQAMEEKHISFDLLRKEAYEEMLSQWTGTVKQTDPVRWRFLTITVDDFFNGVALLTGLRYPRWAARALKRDYYGADDSHSDYRELLCGAYELAASAMPDQQKGVRMLHQLLVEPLCLVRQRTGKLHQIFH